MKISLVEIEFEIKKKVQQGSFKVAILLVLPAFAVG